MPTFNPGSSRHDLPVDHELADRLALLMQWGVDHQQPLAELDALATRLAEALGDRAPRRAFRGIVNLMTGDQYFAGLSSPPPGGQSTGQGSAHLAERTMPRTEGWCVYTLARRRAFPLRDVRDYPRSAGNGAMHRLGVRTYLGAPMIDPATGTSLGTVCTVGTEQTDWTRADVELSKTFAAEAVDLIKLLANPKESSVSPYDHNRRQGGERPDVYGVVSD
jgi:hypothetical protein